MTETAEDTGVVAAEATEIAKTNTKVRPLGDRIIVLEMDGPATTRGGIFLPEGTREKTQRGVVIATGPGPRSPFTAQTVDMGLREGMHIMFAAMTGQEMMIDGITLLVIREADVILVFENIDEDPPADAD